MGNETLRLSPPTKVIRQVNDAVIVPYEKLTSGRVQYRILRVVGQDEEGHCFAEAIDSYGLTCLYKEPSPGYWVLAPGQFKRTNFLERFFFFNTPDYKYVE